MKTIPPCHYLEHTYDQAELHDFALYCMKKYDHQFYGKVAKLPWTQLTDSEDQLKLKSILKNLIENFESIGQPISYTTPRIFYLDPFAYGGIHRDPTKNKTTNKTELVKWAVNIPAVESQNVDLEFFDNLQHNCLIKEHSNDQKDPFGVPEFYQNYFKRYQEQPFKFGELPEEQIDPYYVTPITDTLILDTTVWHRSRSRSKSLSVRFQYQSYFDCQKSYAETIEQLSKFIKN
jgi:hypothetical protein